MPVHADHGIDPLPPAQQRSLLDPVQRMLGGAAFRNFDEVEQALKTNGYLDRVLKAAWPVISPDRLVRSQFWIHPGTVLGSSLTVVFGEKSEQVQEDPWGTISVTETSRIGSWGLQIMMYTLVASLRLRDCV